jgi:hypothetical protein
MADRDLQVAYLLWAPVGVDVVRRFVSSYRAYSAGAAHRLTLLANGFTGLDDPRLVAAKLEFEGIEHDEIVLDRPLLDLAAYSVAAERLAPARCCFLNSYSAILAPNWLTHLSQAIDLPDVGLAGASGSWGSMRSFVRFQFGLGGAYGRVFGDRRATTRTLAAIDRRNSPDAPPPRFLQGKLITARRTVEQTHGFAPFPAPHIRTTGFMIETTTLAQLRAGPLESKIATYRLESGTASITAQVQRLGLRTLVVDRHGRQFEPGDWPASRTFWQGGQENLMIADKQTAHYAEVDDAGREVLAGFAWGERADIAPPPAPPTPPSARSEGAGQP